HCLVPVSLEILCLSSRRHQHKTPRLHLLQGLAMTVDELMKLLGKGPDVQRGSKDDRGRPRQRLHRGHSSHPGGYSLLLERCSDGLRHFTGRAASRCISHQNGSWHEHTSSWRDCAL